MYKFIALVAVLVGVDALLSPQTTRPHQYGWACTIPSINYDCFNSFLECGTGFISEYNANVCYCKWGNNISYDDWCCNQNAHCTYQGLYCAGTTKGYCYIGEHQCANSALCPAEVENDETSQPAAMPLPSAIALICAAFIVGILLSYVVYKVRKSRKTSYAEASASLENSQHSQLGDSQSGAGDKPLIPVVTPLSEQV